MKPCCNTAKIDYTHDNPVEAGFVENGPDSYLDKYLYSSARDYCGIKGSVKVIIG